MPSLDLLFQESCLFTQTPGSYSGCRRRRLGAARPALSSFLLLNLNIDVYITSSSSIFHFLVIVPKNSASLQTLFLILESFSAETSSTRPTCISFSLFHIHIRTPCLVACTTIPPLLIRPAATVGARSHHLAQMYRTSYVSVYLVLVIISF
jgi:hypothetical protein